MSGDDKASGQRRDISMMTQVGAHGHHEGAGFTKARHRRGGPMMEMLAKLDLTLNPE